MAGNTLIEFDPKTLESFTNVQAAIAYFESVGCGVNDNDADGIRSIDIADKDALIAVPFLITQWRFNSGDFGDFVSAEIMTGDGKLFVLNDGSAGIRDQLAELTAHREEKGHPTPTAGRFVRKGLRRSDYNVTLDGKETKAKTYYLSW